jgi:NAD(P)-dependent dehydrogenase (short-subunit alcohol dehydrogenase family)
LLLAKEGAKVVVNDIGANVDGTGRDESFAAQTVAEIKRLGGDAIVNGDDVSSWAGAKNLIDSTVKHFGKLDVLINNAGILRDRMLVNMTEDEWDSVIQVHLKGTFAVINTSSTSGIYGNVGQTNYGAAKAGIAAFTVIAARELRRIGVTVNALSPSAQTRMTEGLRELTPEQLAARDPKWVSPTVVYLASEEASDITGRVFQAGFGRIAICEGWKRGAESPPVEDPREAGRLFREMMPKVRKNSGMDGLELD